MHVGMGWEREDGVEGEVRWGEGRERGWVKGDGVKGERGDG